MRQRLPLSPPNDLDPPSAQRRPLFQTGNNCWRVECARRAAFLIDGEAYFRAFREAAAEARRSIFILGWDFDSRIRLCGDAESDGFSAQLGPFLHDLLMRRRALHVYVLTWDFHMIYWSEREWWLPSKLAAHRRLHFVKDGAHPLGASHHQKVVVIDDRLAFVGGLDFAACRWDTPRHEPMHPARMLPNGRPCRPFHDVQLMVEGPIAAALGDLARERWKRATDRAMAWPSSSDVGDCWPATVPPDLGDVLIAIARTAPAFEGRAAVKEVEALFLDMLSAARRHIYIETQYLTSRTISDRLAARLQDPRGPEIVMVLHPNSDGWLEQHTMDVLRARVLERLRASDRHRRLALYYPKIPGLQSQCISMHAKVCVIDDQVVRVGSANLSNRSMGFDTECDLAIEAGGHLEVRRAIAAFRSRLLGEHLNVPPELVDCEIAQEGSLIRAVERLRGEGRSLESFDGRVSADINDLIPDEHFIDPSQPYDAELIPPERRTPARRQIILGGTALLLLVVLAVLWHWTPLRDYVDVVTLTGYLQQFGEGPAAPLIAIAGFLLGGVVVMPVVILIAVTVLTFGPWWGFLYALIGMTSSAMLTFGVGRLLGRRLMDRLSGSRVYRVSRVLASRGILAIATLRILPVAPFSIINAVAGASHIRTKDFLIGTVLGELPGLLATAWFMNQVTETLRHPGLGSLAVLIGIAAVIVLAVMALNRWLSKKVQTAQQGGLSA
ncbi:MAG TPA: VTT domain-containing protein [Nitrospira sp.]|nr:VTT domain-containing protein [Nitrospira sp.]